MEALILRVHAATDLGRRRAANEDSHAIWISDDPAERERRGALLVVADGMGGTRAGAVASHLAVEAVVSDYASGDAADPASLLRGALERANQVVRSESSSHVEWTGMGTTCTAVAIRGRSAWVAHVGDSRAYLIREGQMHPLTEDHSLVAALVRRREITAEQARSDSRRNVITRSIGLEEAVEVDAGPVSVPLEAGDTLLVCSDGLHGQIADTEMAALATGLDLERFGEELIATANKRGGPDNITVVLARLEAPAAAMPERPATNGHGSAAHPPGPNGKARPASNATLMMILMLALIAALILLVFVIGRRTGGS